MSRRLWYIFGFVKESLIEEKPYNKPVKTNGMSIVLFNIKAYLRNNRFAISKLEPRCKNPVIMKKISDTFFIFIKVFSIAFLIIAQSWKGTIGKKGGNKFY